MISLIESKVVLIFPDGDTKEFATGKQATEESFEKRYDVQSMKANDDRVEVVLAENDGIAKSKNGEGFF